MNVASIKARQLKIEDDETRRLVSVDVPQCIDSIFDRDDGIARAQECESIQFAKRLVVLNDQNRRLPAFWRKKHTAF